jgi:hypothetical protein
MKEEHIDKIIEALMNATFLDDWYFYVLLFSVSLIGAWLGSYIKSSVAEKAKYKAIEANLEIIKKQVSETTKTSEQIKTAIEHGNWRKKELEILKRQKLEQYYAHVALISESLGNEMVCAFYNQDINYDSQNFNKADLIQSLYLPELLEEHIELSKAVHCYKRWLADGLFSISDQGKNGVVNPKPTEEHMNKHASIVNGLVQPTVNVFKKTKEIALKINT